MALFMTRKATPNESDEDLLLAFKKGAREPFLWLFERHRERVIAYAWRMCGRRDVGEDICVEAFAGLIVGVWKPGPLFRLSLAEVVHGMCVAHIRRMGGTRQEAKAFGVVVPGSPEEAAQDLERAAVERAVSSMAEGYRAVLLLYYTMELTTGQIATLLDTDPTQVPLQISYARYLLRHALPEG